MKVPGRVLKAYDAARETRLSAYAPYSKFKVGAALLGGSSVVTGCNVENASYGGTVCAERIAIFKAVSEGQREFSEIVIVTDAPEPAFPCAFCLQVMAEFFEPDVKIYLGDLKELKSVHKFKDLLPKPFGPKQLNAASVASAVAKKARK